MQEELTTRRVLARAAACLGGMSALAERLELDAKLLRDYIVGEAAVPDELLLRAIDVLLDELPASRARAAVPAVLRPD